MKKYLLWLLLAASIALAISCEDDINCDWNSYNTVMDEYKSNAVQINQLGTDYLQAGKEIVYYDSITAQFNAIIIEQSILRDEINRHRDCGCPYSDRYFK